MSLHDFNVGDRVAFVDTGENNYQINGERGYVAGPCPIDDDSGDPIDARAVLVRFDNEDLVHALIMDYKDTWIDDFHKETWFHDEGVLVNIEGLRLLGALEQLAEIEI